MNIEKIHKLFPKGLYIGSILLFLILVCIKLFVLNSTDNTPEVVPWIHILWAFPLTFLMAIALDPKTALSKLLGLRVFVFLGTISYSMYLLHTPILHIVEETFIFTNLFTNLLSILLIIGLTIAFSLLLYKLLEEPYFRRPKIKAVGNVKHSRVLFYKKPLFILATIVVIYIVSIFTAFQSAFNFFSIVSPLTYVIQSPHILSAQKQLRLQANQPVAIQVQSAQDNLQIITMHLIPVKRSANDTLEQVLVFKIKEKDMQQWYAVNTYPLEKFTDKDYPFGFPIIADAKGKTYDIEFSLSNPLSTQTITFDTSENSVKGVYKVDKKQLLKDPVSFISFVSGKIHTVISDPMAQKSLLLFLPFAVIITVLPFI